ncbi:hypothetical protein [Pseudomonas gingeri]|uniref:hypothetical protein n=1 Tax=Pseudomonas gingeri TaxID=117681 RepID=UPI0015A37A48|nr:hypothetical protein [Pseudomonas gingeri]NWE48047.1 hypothetical protein [Pseudomonas gingeri]
MPKSNLELSVEVYKALTNPSIERGRISGELPAESFKNYISELDTEKLLISKDESKNSVTFRALSSKSEFFASSMEDLLKGDSRKKEIPCHFYIAGQENIYGSDSKDPPAEIQGYLDAVELFNALKSIADHGKDLDSKSLIFFHKEKASITIDYTEHDLAPLPMLANFKNKFILDDIHKEQKETIIKAVLLELSKEFDHPLSLGHIIKHFEEFYRRVSSGYQLYVSEFSFQKVKGEVEKSKFEFITKINKVFSEIQNQLLTVPAALIIAGSQFETSNHVTLKNSIILGGALAFTAFMLLLITNQRNTLKSLIGEIDNEWELIKKKHGAIKLQFNEQYKTLETRYKYQYSLLELVSLIVIFACFTTILLFSYFTDHESTPVETAIALGFILIAYIALRIGTLYKIIIHDRFEDKDP